MNKKKVEEFERRINTHLYNEAGIINDMMEADLSPSEWKEIKDFMIQHPYHELYIFLKDKQKIR